MSDNTLYRDLAERTDGSFLLGVVGPVRTGKSSFIKRFMETLVIPNIENPFSRERARDELPQSASGKTIMTAEPKFVPEEAAEIQLADGAQLSVRLIDCVGYMVDGAAGQFEDGTERLVTTPWFDHEVTITEAAEAGTEKVIRDHSSIGIVVTTDGSFGEIPRENFILAEERVIRELQELGKPFVVVLNSAQPSSETAKALSGEIAERYGVNCRCLNCLEMNEDDIAGLLSSVLEEFPVNALSVFLPDWVDALPQDDELRKSVFTLLTGQIAGVSRMKELNSLVDALKAGDQISEAQIHDRRSGQGRASLRLELPRSLYYETLSRSSGLELKNDGDLLAVLSMLSAMKTEYEQVQNALKSVRESGYGVVYPASSELQLAEPQIVRQSGKYSVHLKASAPAIHMMMTQVETEVKPAIGGEESSEAIIGFLLQGFEGDVNRIWESNIFGRSLEELAEESLRGKIDRLPEKLRTKLRETLQRMINESSSGMLCLLL